MKILVLSPYLPHRAVGHGGGVAVRGLVASLAQRHETTLVCLLRAGEENFVDEVAALGIKIIPIPFADRRARGVERLKAIGVRAQALLRGARSGYPLYVEKYWSRHLAQQVIDAVHLSEADAVQVEYLQMALVLRSLRHWRDGLSNPDTGPRLILNTHELGSLPRRRRAAASSALAARRHLAEARAWERLQVDASGWADTTLCVTEQDRELFAAQGGRNLRTVPLGMDTEAITADWQPASPARLLFLGSFGHRPNVLAAEFFLASIWPRIVKWDSTCRLVLAGPGSDTFLAGLDRRPEGVEAVGFVDDLNTLFRESALFVAPLTEGGGIKIKVLEAMARGLPVVTTAIGAEGIVTEADDAVWLAEAGPDFATTIKAALGDPQTCHRRAARARCLMEDKFSWRSITGTLTDIYEAR